MDQQVVSRAQGMGACALSDLGRGGRRRNPLGENLVHVQGRVQDAVGLDDCGNHQRGRQAGRRPGRPASAFVSRNRRWRRWVNPMVHSRNRHRLAPPCGTARCSGRASSALAPCEVNPQLAGADPPGMPHTAHTLSGPILPCRTHTQLACHGGTRHPTIATIYFGIAR